LGQVGPGDVVPGHSMACFQMTYEIGYLLICDRYPYSSVCFWFFQPPNIESVSGVTPAVLVATLENQENNSK